MKNKKVFGWMLIIIFSCLLLFYGRQPENQDQDFYCLANEYFHLRMNQDFIVTNFFYMNRTGKKIFNVALDADSFDIKKFYNTNLKGRGWILEKNNSENISNVYI